MLALDVNILVSALHVAATDFSEMRRWVEEAVEGQEPVGISDAVTIGTVRVLTNRRIYSPPAGADEAWTSMGSILAHPGVVRLTAGPRHLAIVEGLCRRIDARGNLVSDAQHAAVAIEHGATIITKDRDFARFPDSGGVTRSTR